MMRVLTCLWLLLSVFNVCAASLDDARRLYDGGDCAGAARVCREVIAAEGGSAATWYNLGNTQFRLGETGAAILSFERALQLAPRDGDIRANLRLAREAADLPTENTAPWWAAPLYFVSLREWSVLAISGAVLFALAALAAGIVGGSRKRLRRWMAGTLVAGFSFAALGSYALWHRHGEGKLAILTGKSPQLRLSPFTTADPGAKPGTGRTVEITTQSGDWSYVRVLNGSEGWIESREVERIIPSE